jgi:hypothetical protein
MREDGAGKRAKLESDGIMKNGQETRDWRLEKLKTET